MNWKKNKPKLWGRVNLGKAGSSHLFGIFTRLSASVSDDMLLARFEPFSLKPCSTIYQLSSPIWSDRLQWMFLRHQEARVWSVNRMNSTQHRVVLAPKHRLWDNRSKNLTVRRKGKKFLSHFNSILREIKGVSAPGAPP